MSENEYKWTHIDSAPKKRARASVTNMLHQIKGGRDRYEYVFTIGKMLIES